MRPPELCRLFPGPIAVQLRAAAKAKAFDVIDALTDVLAAQGYVRPRNAVDREWWAQRADRLAAPLDGPVAD